MLWKKRKKCLSSKLNNNDLLICIDENEQNYTILTNFHLGSKNIKFLKIY